MKKIFINILCIILIITGFTGCGNKKNDFQLSKVAKDIYADIQETKVLPDMMEMDSEYLSTYYGIDTEKLSDYYFSQATISINVDTVFIAQVKDIADVNDMKDKIQKILDSKASEMENYLADMYSLIKESSIKVKGKVIYLVISKQADDIEKIIEKNIA